MQPLEEAAVMVGLFLIRLGIPLVVTILVTWGLRRLDAHWQAEADARQLNAAVADGEIAPSEVLAPAARKEPCWEYRDCPETAKRNCPACGPTDLPCWMARLRAEGKLPGRCYGCERFKTRVPLQEVLA